MQQKGWEFIGNNGEFILENPTLNNYLYFPLVNEAGMMSSIAPSLHGNINTGQNSFVSEPLSAIDLHNNKSSRNFWLLIDNKKVWSATGYSSKQETYKFDENKNENVKLEAGMLFHKIIRENKKIKIKSEIINFVPITNDCVELMKITITNTGNKTKSIVGTSAIPLFGRSADNLRDHRHVTSLLNVIKTVKDGIILTPTLSFDERGHKINKLSYMVLGRGDKNKSPIGFYPVFDDFIGEGGSLTWPKSIINNNNNYCKSNEIIKGHEAVGALKFEEFELKPNEIKSFIIAIVVSDKDDRTNFGDKYCSIDSFQKHLEENKKYWNNITNNLKFNSSDFDFDQWMKWVTIQPTLRKLYGNSFLPHHDYGRGGRGWRDLWQDALALLFIYPKTVKDILFNNFAGVRFDGSNATIIGPKSGKFKADRNGINRVWMDHGVWPFLTTKLYINRSGDLEFLLKKQSYFRDNQLNRSEKVDENWNFNNKNILLDKNNNTYYGTLLEHILIQHLSIFFNVGDNNNFKLESGDWNDGLDMARDRGESVAFTGLYANNILEIAELLKELQNKLNINQIELAKEINILLDTLNKKIDYSSPKEKQKLLKNYFESCEKKVSGKKIKVDINNLIVDLKRKGSSIKDHIRENEWVTNKDGYEWYNAYYDNDGNSLEGDHPLGVRMTLTGQVFSIMSNIATDKQINKIINSVNHYLKDEKVGGYRLNTNFNEVKLKLGRAFGFAYGEKENGAMFSHMSMMYSNALYRRNFALNGFEVINSLYNHCKKFEVSKIYPGIPEYIDSRGRGLYHYLTGSASWLLLTMIEEVYGIVGELGDLKLNPKLIKSQFDKENKTSIKTNFADRKLKIIYSNPNLKSFSDYTIVRVKINNKKVDFIGNNSSAVLKRNTVSKLNSKDINIIEVLLN
ncbi:MAG: cellobiose phosphorylase [Halanaerobiales bacterium]|nr:cellobiose phosphorylase [Halanaerobiales bacterium]HKL43454.1 cellobiose phosphorylase [Clostridia bacterium]